MRNEGVTVMAIVQNMLGTLVVVQDIKHRQHFYKLEGRI
jgi:hypothetical protein